MVNLRPADARDVDGIARVWRASIAAADGAAPETRPHAYFRDRVAAERDAGWRFTVAERDGRIVGFSSVHLADSVLGTLFIAPDAQRAGIGLALLNRAKTEMPDGFILRTWTTNRLGRAFYEREGFRLLAEGLHPLRDMPLCIYGWNTGPDVDPSALLR